MPVTESESGKETLAAEDEKLTRLARVRAAIVINVFIIDSNWNIPRQK